MRPRVIFAAIVLVAVTLAGTASRAEAKQKIAVLGIEPDDTTGTSDKTTNLSRWITDGLRQRAQQAKAKFELGANTNKDLSEMKLVADCLDERLECMSNIGGDLGVDHVIYGKLSKTKTGWTLSLKYLNVATKQLEGQQDFQIASSDATEDGVRKLATTAFAKVTGIVNAGSIEIQANVDNGTIYVDGSVKSAISGRAASVPDLPEGTYNVAVEAEGKKRWEKTITVRGGEPTLVVVEMEDESVGGGGGGGGSGGSGGGGGGGGGARPGGTARTLFWTSLVVTAGGGTAFVITGLKVRGYEDDKLTAIQDSRKGKQPSDVGFINAGPNDDACAEAKAEGVSKLSGICSDAKSMATMTNVLIGVTVVAGIATGYFYYKGYIAPKARNDREHAKRKGTQHAAEATPGEIIVAPQVYKDGAGLGAIITF
jgi:hypothetical protein